MNLWDVRIFRYKYINILNIYNYHIWYPDFSICSHADQAVPEVIRNTSGVFREVLNATVFIALNVELPLLFFCGILVTQPDSNISCGIDHRKPPSVYGVYNSQLVPPKFRFMVYFRWFATLILSWRPSGIHGMIPARSSFSMTSPWSWNHEYGSQSLQCGYTYILDMHNDVMLPKLKVKSSHWVCCFVMRVYAWICCASRVSNLKAIPRNIIGKRRALRCWFWSDFDSNKGMAQLIHRTPHWTFKVSAVDMFCVKDNGLVTSPHTIQA